MSRQETLADIRQTLGIVPGFLEQLPDQDLEADWSTMKGLMMDTALPVKTKALVGIGAAAALRCHYCVPFMTGLAQLSGATDQEIQEANLVAKAVGGHSVYLNGVNYDHDVFMKELQQIAEHVGKAAGAGR